MDSTSTPSGIKPVTTGTRDWNSGSSDDKSWATRNSSHAPADSMVCLAASHAPISLSLRMICNFEYRLGGSWTSIVSSSIVQPWASRYSSVIGDVLFQIGGLRYWVLPSGDVYLLRLIVGMVIPYLLITVHPVGILFAPYSSASANGFVNVPEDATHVTQSVV